jgi:SAM-dependent methyltransferase
MTGVQTSQPTAPAAPGRAIDGPPSPAPGGIDYTVYYKLWHDDSPESERRTVEFAKGELRPFLPPNLAEVGPVLDVGCGDGHAMVALRELGCADVRGVEIDPGQAEACRKRGLAVDLAADTVAYLLERPGRYGMVVLLDVLEHVPTPVQIPMMRAIFAALRPGGRVIVRVPNATNPVFARWLYQDHTHHCSFTEMSLYFILANAGFVNVRTPGSGKLGFPPVFKLQRNYRTHLRKWIVRWWWRLVLRAEAPFLNPDVLCLDLNLMSTAQKPGPGVEVRQVGRAGATAGVTVGTA